MPGDEDGALVSRVSKILLYGGSFDPIHNGHLALARQIQDKYNADVKVIPVKNPFKDESLFPLEDRITITKKAFEFCPRIEVVDWSLTWDKMESTYECVRQFKEKNPGEHDLYVVMGSDALPKLDKWDQVDKLAKEIKLLVVHRQGYGYDPSIATQLGFTVETMKNIASISSSAIRKNEVKWRTHVPANVWALVKGRLDEVKK